MHGAIPVYELRTNFYAKNYHYLGQRLQNLVLFQMSGYNLFSLSDDCNPVLIHHFKAQTDWDLLEIDLVHLHWQFEVLEQ